MRAIYFTSLLPLSVLTSVTAQTQKDIYDPSIDGTKQLQSAIQKAEKQRKFVLVQVGGNWCSWCHKLNNLFSSDTGVSSMLERNFVVVHLNYSKENRNQNALQRLGNPIRFGFPVLVVLDCEGRRLHVQDSALLEGGKTHDPEKVIRFLQLWSPTAVEESNCSNVKLD